MKHPFAYPIAIIALSIDAFLTILEALIGFRLVPPSRHAVCQHI